MAEAGRNARAFPPISRERLARATVTGAGELLFQSELSPATLRQNVTSPGGTTAAALEILMADPGGLKALMRRCGRCGKAACRRTLWLKQGVAGPARTT